MKKIRRYITIPVLASLFFVSSALYDKAENSNSKQQSSITVKDIDGNVYKTIKIGSQIWTTENLKTTRYNDGTIIPNVLQDKTWEFLKTDAYCNYDNIESNVALYGRLYNWYAVHTGKLAPAGWHVPTNEDWSILENYLTSVKGGQDNVAKSLASNIYWNTSSIEGAVGNDISINNSSGFMGLPAGYRSYTKGEFVGIGDFGTWWSSTGNSQACAFCRYLASRNNELRGGDNYKNNGYSIRLVKD